MGSQAVPEFLTELRNATRASHERLHQHRLLAPLFAERVDLSDYVRILESFYGFYRPLEKRLAQAASPQTENTGWVCPLRSRWLKDDLIFLGHQAQTLQDLPICQERFVLSQPSDIWGTLYVLEGSTLGGRVVARRIFDLYGPAMKSACHFFSSYGQDASSRWPAFQKDLRARARSETFRRGTIEAACRLFASLERWLDANIRTPRASTAGQKARDDR